MPKCAFAGCDAEGERARRSERNGTTYHYCPDHDPLESDQSFAFTEVDDDE